MFTQLQEKSKVLLDYIKKNPNHTMPEIAEALHATHSKAQVAQGLWALWHGRYVTRKASATAKGDNGMSLFDYQFKTDRPRILRQKGKGVAKRVYLKREATVQAPVVQQSAVKPGAAMELLIAVKGSKETTVLSVEQVRDLVEQLKQLQQLGL